MRKEGLQIQRVIGISPEKRNHRIMNCRIHRKLRFCDLVFLTNYDKIDTIFFYDVRQLLIQLLKLSNRLFQLHIHWVYKQIQKQPSQVAVSCVSQTSMECWMLILMDMRMEMTQ